MATTKKSKGGERPAGSMFPLGDPEGAVRWTPAMLKKVFPRRELGLKPLSLDTPESLATEMHEAAAAWWERFELGSKVEGADAALHATLAEARAWLAAGAVERPTCAVAALAYQFTSAGDGFREESLAARMVDLWVLRFGLVFALDALCEAFTVGYAMGDNQRAVTFPARKVRRGYGSGPTMTAIFGELALVRTFHNQLVYLRAADIALAASGNRTPSLHFVNDECRAWLRLREHLATAPQAAWEATLPRAEALIAHPSSLVRNLVAFAYPERPAWAESLTGERGHAVFTVLSSSVRDPSKLEYAALEYFFKEFERGAVSMLAASGPKAVRPLLEAAANVRATPQKRFLLGLVAQVDTDEAVDALLALGDAAHAAAAVEAMRTNFPARVAARAR
ncbi:MAG: hypothetical protein U0326_17115 [Polyangiales bacterium]